MNNPKPKDESWQEGTGRAVSVLAIAFLKEESDDAALRMVALLSLAQASGAKEARKRALKLSRWAEQPPPPLSSLPTHDERLAALTALSKIGAGWAHSYVARELSGAAATDELIPDLLKWARGVFSDPATFVHDLYAPLIGTSTTAQRCAVLLKEAPRLLRPAAPCSAGVAASVTSALAEAFCTAPAVTQGDDKSLAPMAVSVLAVLQDHAAVYPAILLQPAFALAITRLRGLGEKGAASKTIAGVSEVLSLATVSLLTADVLRFGASALAAGKAMLPVWRSAYAKWDEHLAAAALGSPAVQAWIDGKASEDPKPGDAYEAEATFARLLPAWDAFVSELPDSTRAASLSAMLLEAAATARVYPIGRAGEQVPYDPLAHHLAQDREAVPGQVRIARAGLEARRPDGSTRVLVQALVTPV
ncbi:hypothetical protein [Variovorax sp. LjRoot178]|uniref:hypothetical protein n=1 Tax=Variovorax sp. LjRoot178 TaxID=3342277 RepID=UPI003F515822